MDISVSASSNAQATGGDIQMGDVRQGSVYESGRMSPTTVIIIGVVAAIALIGVAVYLVKKLK